MLRIIENSKECISENCEKCESREAIPNSHTCCLLLSINHDEDVCMKIHGAHVLVCLQEKDIEEIKQRLIDGYANSFWTCSVSKLGYSGTAIISRVC